MKSLLRPLLEEIPCERPTSRLTDIDAARGVAIILVVVGHVVVATMPLGNDWYAALRVAIYRFHMALFMALTGITFALSLPLFGSWRQVLSFSARRVRRLLPAYLLMGLAILGGKMVATKFIHIDNPPSGLFGDILRLILIPDRSVARFLWFIYVLSMYFVIVPVFFQAFGRRPGLLLALGTVLCFGDWTPLLMLDRAIAYLPFFAGGMVLWIHRSSWSPMRPWVFWTSAFIFGSLFALALHLSIPNWLFGTWSVPAVVGLMQRIPSSLQLFLGWIGQNSLSIYLFNGIAMGLTKGLLFKVISWDGVNFLFYFPILVLAGVAIPMAGKRFVSSRFPRIAKYL